jgi:integrase
VTADVAQLAATVASIAYYLELPPAEMTPLKAVLARVRQPPRTEITDRNTRILAALDDPATRACLLHLPRHLMGMAARQRDGWTNSKTGLHHSPRPIDAAWLASVAVAIEILLHAPMRIKNLQHLQIGQGLRLASTGRGRWSGTILVAGVTTKNGIGLEVPLEAETITLLREYLEEHRGALPHADTAWLFPGEASPDRPRNKGAFGLAITEGIHAIVGLRINPHAFRAIAGSFILEANPHAIDDVRAMLGQSTFHTALIYYRRRNQHAAAGRLSETLARQRRSTRLLASARMLAPDLMRGMRRGVR